MYKRANKLQDLIGDIFYNYPKVEPGPRAITRGGRILTDKDLDRLTEHTRDCPIPDNTPLKMPSVSYKNILEPGSRALVQDGKILSKPQLQTFVRRLRARAWAKDVLSKIKDAGGYFNGILK